MTEFAGLSDRLIVEAYQAAHNDRKPGGSAEDMTNLEQADRQLVRDALWRAGGELARYDFGTPVGRLAAWAAVDRLNSQPEPVYGWLDMEQMRRTA